MEWKDERGTAGVIGREMEYLGSHINTITSRNTCISLPMLLVSFPLQDRTKVLM